MPCASAGHGWVKRPPEGEKKGGRQEDGGRRRLARSSGARRRRPSPSVSTGVESEANASGERSGAVSDCPCGSERGRVGGGENIYSVKP